MGPGNDDDKSIRIPNRVVQWDREGILYEADQRHAGIIIAKLGLKGGSRSVNTPGTKPGELREEHKD